MPEPLPPLNDLPPRIAALPVDEHGIHLPWMLDDQRVLDLPRAHDAMKDGRCGICNGPLNSFRYLLYPTLTHALHRLTPLPALHLRCATWFLRSAATFLPTPDFQCLEYAAAYGLRYLPKGDTSALVANLEPDDEQRKLAIYWWQNGQLADKEALLEAIDALGAELRAHVTTADEDTGLSMLIAETKARAGDDRCDSTPGIPSDMPATASLDQNPSTDTPKHEPP